MSKQGHLSNNELSIIRTEYAGLKFQLEKVLDAIEVGVPCPSAVELNNTFNECYRMNCKICWLTALKTATEKKRQEESAMELTRLADDVQSYELTIPVTLKVSTELINPSDVRNRILNALLAWLEDGPGFVDENKEAITVKIEVGEPEKEPFLAMPSDAFCRIVWCDEDLMKVFEGAKIDPSPENIEKFKNSTATKVLKERSVEEGWTILNDLVWGLVCDGTFEKPEEVVGE